MVEVYGHQLLRSQMQERAQRVDRGRAILLQGPPGSGKLLLASEYAKAIFLAHAHQVDPQARIRAWEVGELPDYIVMQPEGSTQYKIDQIRDMLQTTLRAPLSGVRIVVIPNAQRLTPAAQDALLKSLEEGPSHTSYILTQSVETFQLLGTLTSRCVVYSVGHLMGEELEKACQNACGMEAWSRGGVLLPHLSRGVPGRAAWYAEGQRLILYRDVLRLWCQHPNVHAWQWVQLSATHPEVEDWFEVVSDVVQDFVYAYKRIPMPLPDAVYDAAMRQGLRVFEVASCARELRAKRLLPLNHMHHIQSFLIQLKGVLRG